MADVRVIYQDRYGGSEDVSLEMYRDPEAMLFKGACQDPLHAQVCGQCGLTELYAQRPDSLWKLYNKEEVGDGS